MEESVKPYHGILLGSLLWLAIGLSLSIWAFHAYQAVALLHVVPGVVGTSGSEEDSWVAILNQISGKGAYQDVHRIPFSAAYFNLLYYKSYAWICGRFSPTMGPVAVQMVGRLFTFALSALGVSVLFTHLTSTRDQTGTRLMAIALALFAFAGPLPGWWVVTVRPDVGSMLFEAIGIMAFARWCREPRWGPLLLAFLGYYLAWSYKPTYLGGLAASMLTLLWLRRWRELFVGGGLSVGLWLLTLALGGSAYRAMIFHTATTNHLTVQIGWINLEEGAAKLLPLLLGLALTLVIAHPPKQSDRDPKRTEAGFLWTGLVLIFCYSFAISCKEGAGSNYYFSFSVFLVLQFWNRLAGLDPRSGRSVAAGTIAAICILQGLILTGKLGKVSLFPTAQEQARVWTRWSDEAEPRFSSDVYFNVPWLNPHSLPLVLGFNYHLERTNGVPFEGDGVGGMIRRREFRSILLRTEQHGQFDGAILEGYQPAYSVGNFTVFRRTAD